MQALGMPCSASLPVLVAYENRGGLVAGPSCCESSSNPLSLFSIRLAELPNPSVESCFDLPVLSCFDSQAFVRPRET